jgi:hypothetical protein
VNGDPETVFDAAGRIRSALGHGTFAAGVVRCMAPSADVWVDGALGHAGAVFESDLIELLDGALERRPAVIGLSAGTLTRHGLPLLGFEVFWEARLRNYPDVALVAPAGDSGLRGACWPAAFSWAVGVGALGGRDGRSRARFSNYGGGINVYAPGERLINAFAKGSYVGVGAPFEQQRVFDGMAEWSGTSFSAAMVAGLIAARMSKTGENARQAVDSLLRDAQVRAIPGVGRALFPGQQDSDELDRSSREQPAGARVDVRPTKRAGLESGESVVVSPVFGVPRSGQVNDVFVIMPFREGLRPVYEDHIRPVAEGLGLTIGRADDLFTTHRIIDDIWASLSSSRIIIADCTGHNANVFYELGIAHTIGKPVILIAQSEADVPFDLRQFRYIIYTYTAPGMTSFERSLRKTLESIL